MTRARWVGIAVGLLVAIQLVPLSRSNPPIESALAAPPDVQAILDRSCMDCHSHATRWPWYAYVAPASWLVVYDVHHAREHLNFSRWGSYAPDRQRKKLEEMLEEAEGGSMPMTPYLWIHSEAKLSEQDLATLLTFIEGRVRELEADAHRR
ncbi:MAG TPA: heme-binding domain-containing protein [Myxococcota bacterium]|nr:heme-binding domain-containing protein [Myxococcota bacterium]